MNRAAFIVVAGTLLVGAAGPILVSSSVPATREDAGDAVARGERALLGKSEYWRAGSWKESAFQQVWKRWGLESRPADFDAQVRSRYGLMDAPYPNDGLPMGLRFTGAREGGERTITQDCLFCHGGSIAGRVLIGLPNTLIAVQQFSDDMDAMDGRNPPKAPFDLGDVRGLNRADSLAVLLTAFRNADMSWNKTSALRGRSPDLGWSTLPSTDTPAWWLWKDKKWIYYGGEIDARSHESSMFLILSQFRRLDGADIQPMAAEWEHVRSYIQATVEPPPYPFRIDARRVEHGDRLFHGRAGCFRCHGDYSRAGQRRLSRYDTPVIPIDRVRTDPQRLLGMRDEFVEKYNSIPWFSARFRMRRQGERPFGYVAPPLTGIWATAPYLHNGAVPTIGALLSPELRPRRFYRHPRTDADVYDTDALGWKVVDCAVDPCRAETLPYTRMIYDTRHPGLGNGGHPFGTRLSAPEKRDLIEFLKTL
jgi:hypothetical protein